MLRHHVKWKCVACTLTCTLLPLPPMQIRINVPSYCDRVLWKSYPGTYISNTSYGNWPLGLSFELWTLNFGLYIVACFCIKGYTHMSQSCINSMSFCFTSLFPGCTHDIMTSDHSPVFATFQIGGVKQYAWETGLRSRKVQGGREREGGRERGRQREKEGERERKRWRREREGQWKSGKKGEGLFFSLSPLPILPWPQFSLSPPTPPSLLFPLLPSPLFSHSSQTLTLNFLILFLLYFPLLSDFSQPFLQPSPMKQSVSSLLTAAKLKYVLLYQMTACQNLQTSEL